MSFRRSATLLVLCAMLAIGLRAQLAPWVQHLPSTSALRTIFWRAVQLPTGAVSSRRPPRETVPELTKALATVQTAELLSLRAREAELNLDFTQAETDWKRYAGLVTERGAGSLALADYYHRRLQPELEVDALLAAASAPAGDPDRFRPAREQSAYALFRRALDLADRHALPRSISDKIFEARASRYPAEPQVLREYFEALAAASQFPQADAVIERYAKTFPADDLFPVEARAQLAAARGNPEAVLPIFEKAFRPVSSPTFIASYFATLQASRRLGAFLADAQQAVQTRPLDLIPAVHVFYYHQQKGDLPQAHRALLEFRQRKLQSNSRFTRDELSMLAQLFSATQNYREAVRHFDELYRSFKAEEGLANIIDILFKAPDQPLGIGDANLTYYRDIATIDSHPGALNGILSLLFNSESPRDQFANQEQAAMPYFRRAKAAELLAEYDRSFPNGAARARLHFQLIDAYAKHGKSEVVIQRGREYLTRFPSTAERTSVWLAIAEAHARLGQTKEEFAVYDSLLQEIAKSIDNVPLGYASDNIPQDASSGRYRPKPAGNIPRSSAYVQVLDRYLSRLTSQGGIRQALEVLRREIDRNPNDPGLYERLAEFLNQNEMAREVDQVYTRAIKQFQDRSWHDKLARWYLRQKQTAAFEALVRDVVNVFSGSELDTFFQELLPQAELDAVLYRQVNLYAHTRFPHDLVFVKNLLQAYSTPGTADPAAREKLLREHWYHDLEIRNMFFQMLSQSGRLDRELAALLAAPAATRNTRAAPQWIAEAHAWKSHFEESSPIYERIAADYPGERALSERAASLARSLGNTESAKLITDRMYRSEPRDRELLARAGDILADKDQLGAAAQYWDRMATIEPGNPDGYVEAATVYWDYYRFDDALRVIGQAREQLKQPALFAYEAGAIHESKRDYKSAVVEYARAASSPFIRAGEESEGYESAVQPGPATDMRAQSRLLRLVQRPALRPLIEAETKGIPEANPDLARFQLRVAILEAESRRTDLAALLTATARASTSADLLTRIHQIAASNELIEPQRESLARQIALATSVTERLRLQMSLASFAESTKDAAEAQKIYEAMLRDSPQIVGVVRASTDYFWRNGQRDRAIAILDQSASRANATYSRAFRLESARKATSNGQHARARSTLDSLLKLEPLASDLLTAMADTYAAAGDDTGLRSFYSAKLKEAKDAETQTRLRRGLLPVLTRLKQHSAAVDEYIEILKRYPEDQQLTTEAVNYARRHGQLARLDSYFASAAQSSPKDARWPMILARIQTQSELLPAARESYNRAIALRPERTDLLMARAQIEDRLLRFEDSATSYAKLYELTYQDPRWMVQAAQARARLGQKQQAIELLERAFLKDRAPKSADYLEIARRLENWNWIEEAAKFAQSGAETPVDKAYALMLKFRLRPAGASDFSDPKLLGQAAGAVRQFYTPEEKAQLVPRFRALPAQDGADLSLAAGLYGVAAEHMFSMATPPNSANALIDLQKRRLQNAELAGQLEKLWEKSPADDSRDGLLAKAAQQYRAAGATAAELRVLKRLLGMGALLQDEEGSTRFLEWAAKSSPQDLIDSARNAENDDLRRRALNVALDLGTPELALKTVAARGANLPPVWGKVHTALTGVYLDRRTPDIFAAFSGALGPRTIGEQIAASKDRTQYLVGETWFPFAGNYAEFLARAGRPEADDYYAADAEDRPASGESYLKLAEFFFSTARDQNALEEYRRSLQVDAGNPLSHTRLAQILTRSGNREAALPHWKTAFALWSGMQNRALNDSFWREFTIAVDAIRTSDSWSVLSSDVERLVSTYIRNNGTYRADEMVRPLYNAAGAGTAGVQLIASFARVAPSPTQYLRALTEREWLPEDQKDILFGQLLTLSEAEASGKAGDARQEAQTQLNQYRFEYLEALVKSRRAARAREIWQSWETSVREALKDRAAVVRIMMIAGSPEMDTSLEAWTSGTEAAPEDSQLLLAANELRKQGDPSSARKLLRFLYSAQLERQDYNVSAFTGLAELHLEASEIEPALALLRRMAVLVAEPFESYLASAATLEKFGRKTEALEFYRLRVRAVPWDHAARLALSIATDDKPSIEAIAKDRNATYETRAAAARQLRGVTGMGSGELDLLASGAITPATAARPFFLHARLAGADQASEASAKLNLMKDAIAIDPYATELRLKLFRTAAAAGNDRLAMSAMDPMLDEVVLRATEEYSSSSRIEYLTEQFLPQMTDRATLARELARVARRLQEPGRALLFLRIARAIDASANVAAEIAELETEIERQEENNRRKPQFHDGVEQQNRVRPRLLARRVEPAQPAKPAAVKPVSPAAPKVVNR